MADGEQQAQRDVARQRWQAVRPPKLPLFTGDIDGCELEEFAREAQRIIHHYGLEDLGGEAAEWVIQSLEGAARREVIGRPPQETANANQVIGVLEATFGDQRSLSSLLSAFHSRRQRINEGVLLSAVHAGTTKRDRGRHSQRQHAAGSVRRRSPAPCSATRLKKILAGASCVHLHHRAERGPEVDAGRR